MMLSIDPSKTTYENDYPFVESASFADNIKYSGGGFQSPWHFIDIPFFDQGGSLNDYPQFKEASTDIEGAIEGIVAWFQQSSGYKNNYAYTSIMNYAKGNEDLGLSIALRFLIHFVGDIHQPLHCLARIDDNYQAGDKGGNLFPVPNHYSADNLHSVWDSVMYEFHTNDKLVSKLKLISLLSLTPQPLGTTLVITLQLL